MQQNYNVSRIFTINQAFISLSLFKVGWALKGAESNQPYVKTYKNNNKNLSLLKIRNLLNIAPVASRIIVMIKMFVFICFNPNNNLRRRTKVIYALKREINHRDKRGINMSIFLLIVRLNSRLMRYGIMY